MSASYRSLLPPVEIGDTLSIENITIQGFLGAIHARIYRPTIVGYLPGVLYFHGGGFIGGTLDDADIPARHIAEHASTVVLSVAYSLAPKHPFPAAPEDAYAALIWLQENSLSLKVNSKCIGVAGDDAGGNLAATLPLIARDRNACAISAQVLIGPMLDPSMTKLGDPFVLGSDIQPETCASCYSQYLPRTSERLHPYASPLDSRRLKGLPPALIATAQCDVLHKEAEQYATALISAGVEIQVVRTTGNHAALPRDPKLLREIADFLRRYLHRNCESEMTRALQARYSKSL